MSGEATGRYVTISTVGAERVRAFVPHPLPPKPPLEIESALQQRLDGALVALGRLDSVASRLPSLELLLYAYVRKEAVLSSQIEGTQSTLTDLLLFELDEAPGVPLDDVKEVSSYVAALDHGVQRLRGGFPLSNRLLREVHAILLGSGRGSDKRPGEFRRSQNWIGGTRPGNAIFVPPPPQEIEPAMAGLERFLHDEPAPTPPLVKAALAHVQFETVHPFLDGNGRVGRMLITLSLLADGVLRAPLLYLSLFFRRHRRLYYERLDAVRREGAWGAWLDFFAQGVSETATSAFETANRLEALVAADRARLAELGRRRGSTPEILAAFERHPIASTDALARRTSLPFTTVSRAIERLEELGLVAEVTGRRRNRRFAYSSYLKLLNDETVPRAPKR